ncbi:hypothetical protein TNIN_168551 [Trichonephila inaurata madagascariensis]|uniref:Uncharacterized protein n=1 Tax=Trichonephila inaurata madagascariensis TaxID=2747483 RepID=A0A8X6XRP7_9ARAC|nr:hypothetical protein TNIN_168551 [Trichonephila inaurata madagascariensis]
MPFNTFHSNFNNGGHNNIQLIRLGHTGGAIERLGKSRLIKMLGREERQRCDNKQEEHRKVMYSCRQSKNTSAVADERIPWDV